MTRAFSWPVRVYWEDTDAGGIVYYANYLKFMERARSEWLRSVGFEQTPLKEEHGIMFVVVDVEAHYRKPARYGELLRVTCRVQSSTRASLTFSQEVFRKQREGARAEEAEELLVESTVRVASLDAVTFRPCALPPALLGRLLESIGMDVERMNGR
jgi:acyl-CoA thioester hydrolase